MQGGLIRVFEWSAVKGRRPENWLEWRWHERDIKGDRRVHIVLFRQMAGE